MSDLGTPALLTIFLAAALATWVAGVNLAKATDLLDDRYGLGEALGGMILLSVGRPRSPNPGRRARPHRNACRLHGLTGQWTHFSRACPADRASR